MKKIALVAGGYTDEFVISIKSASTIYKYLDKSQFEIYNIVIDANSWRYVSDSGEEILVDKNDFSINIQGEKVKFDAAYITVHGTPGEDGRLQGYLDMLGIPYTTCNAVTSALTFNKSFCNKVVKDLGVIGIANSTVLYKHIPYSLGTVLEKVKLPVFVKPNEAGSSLGTSRVDDVSELLPAIERSFEVDEQVIIEEFIEGREFTIGVYKVNDEVKVLPPTEIISGNKFFDYEAKYQGNSKEVTPADITETQLQHIQSVVRTIYYALNCHGVVRIDFIIKPNGEFYFLEINTTPGQSEASIIPQQVRASGLNLTEFYGDILKDSLQ